MEYNKQQLLEEGISADPELTKEEKETAMCFPNDLDMGTIYTEVPTVIKWVFSVEETVIRDVRRTEKGDICAVDAKIPKSILKLQGNSRKSNSHSQMVSYGPNK